jgi:hypothetical protein
LAMLLKTGVSAFSLEVCSQYHVAAHQNPSQTTCRKYKYVMKKYAVVVKSKIILGCCCCCFCRYACSCTCVSNYKQFRSDINKVFNTMHEFYSSTHTDAHKNVTHNQVTYIDSFSALRGKINSYVFHTFYSYKMNAAYTKKCYH